VNTRIRKAIKKGAKVFAIGPETELTYKVEWLGADLSIIGNLPEAAVKLFTDAKKPMVIVGGGALKGGHGAALAFAKQFNLVRDGWNGFNVVHMAASRMGGLMLGYAQKGGVADLRGADVTFLLGADELNFDNFGGFKVYVGHHGDQGAHHADVILPGATYAEKSGTWVNLEGRVQRGERAVFPPGDAREDWAIFRALSDVLGHTLPFDSLAGLREAMGTEVPALRTPGLATFEWNPPALDAAGQGSLSGYPIKDFYLTNAICRASPTMQRCSAELVHGETFAEAAE
jgi:NADH-quinone oxidoreductase subunit G